MIEIGDVVTVDGRTWRNIRDPDGFEGFVPAQYLVEELIPKEPTIQVLRCTAATKAYVDDMLERFEPIANSGVKLAELVELAGENDAADIDTEAYRILFVSHLVIIAGASQAMLEEVPLPSDPLAQIFHPSFRAQRTVICRRCNPSRGGRHWQSKS